MHLKHWLEDSEELVAQLRGTEFRMGIGEELRLLRLLDILNQRKVAIEDAETLAKWLSPLLCTRSDQMDRLKEILAPYFSRSSTPSGPVEPPSYRPSTALLLLSLAWVVITGYLAYELYPTFEYLILQFSNTITNSLIPIAKRVLVPNEPTANDPLLNFLKSGALFTLPIMAVLVFLAARRARLALRRSRVA